MSSEKETVGEQRGLGFRRFCRQDGCRCQSFDVMNTKEGDTVVVCQECRHVWGTLDERQTAGGSCCEECGTTDGDIRCVLMPDGERKQLCRPCFDESLTGGDR